MMRARLGGSLVVLVALACGACRKGETDALPSAAARADAAPPPDHLGDGELLEGAEKAFALPLPRGMHVDQAFVDVVHASGPPPVADVTGYVRARVRMGTVEIGPQASTFDRVQLPGLPGREFAIRVSAAASGTRLDVRDVTRPVLPPGEAERWRAAGLTPEGKPLDKNRLE